MRTIRRIMRVFAWHIEMTLPAAVARLATRCGAPFRPWAMVADIAIRIAKGDRICQRRATPLTV